MKQLCNDSRVIKPGDIFLAYPGEKHDGRDFIRNAVDKGAAAVLWEKKGYRWNYGFSVKNIGVSALRNLEGEIANQVYGRPSEQLWIVGVTGTNGKTSTSYWIAQNLNARGKKTALIGTIGSGFPEALRPSSNTTPDALTLHKELAMYMRKEAQAVVMEVSSHALTQGRVNAIAFDVALFTNLTRDHLDYHGDMKNYAEAKTKLFTKEGLKHAVLNLDDALGTELGKRLTGRVNRVGYRIETQSYTSPPVDAYLEASKIIMSPQGTVFSIRGDWGNTEIETHLIGKFNVSNLLGVLGTLLVSGISFKKAVQAMTELIPPPGRMQRLGGNGKPLIVIDYAHTPDALEKVLMTLRELIGNEKLETRNQKLICVFGCGGERDTGKRPLMGEIASRYADTVVLTSDNPRSEDPLSIIEAIRTGVAKDCLKIVDREEAIFKAIQLAKSGDVVLLAGKGHETYQEVNGKRHAFSDYGVAMRALGGKR